jgi:Ca2+-binding EF-hand superfamily protein
MVQEKSEEILDQKKARKFHQIFMLLDSDGDEYISAERIDISQLAPNLLELFTPLF